MSTSSQIGAGSFSVWSEAPTTPWALIDHRHHGPLRTPLPIRNRRPRRRTRPGTRPSRDGPNADQTQIRRHRPQRPI